MIFSTYNFQVLNRVVSFVSVQVMDMLPPMQRSPKIVSHHPAMFRDISAIPVPSVRPHFFVEGVAGVYRHLSVPVPCVTSTAFVSAMANAHCLLQVLPAVLERAGETSARWVSLLAPKVCRRYRPGLSAIPTLDSHTLLDSRPYLSVGKRLVPPRNSVAQCLRGGWPVDFSHVGISMLGGGSG